MGGTYDGHLIVRVKQRAVDGAATEGVVRSVAESFGVSPRDVALIRGATSRTKTLEITGESAVLAARLRVLEDSAD